MNCLGSGACTFSLLPLELLHVELKLLTFQDVPDKIMPENNIRWCNNKSTQKILRSNYQTHPSALPHWPGREDMQANNRPPPNCSSIWGSSVRTCTRFSIFLVRWLLFFVSSTVAPSASCLYKYAMNLVSLMNSKYAIDSIPNTLRQNTRSFCHKLWTWKCGPVRGYVYALHSYFPWEQVCFISQIKIFHITTIVVLTFQT